MTLIITGVDTLIHIYAFSYMETEPAYWRFFTYLNLFIFAMLNLVLADNYVLLFLGWEGVGLCSYLLIGFWYDRKFGGTSITWTGDAANKAFWVNRIGDFGFSLAVFLVFITFGSLDFDTVFAAASKMPVESGLGILTAIGLLLMVGAALLRRRFPESAQAHSLLPADESSTPDARERVAGYVFVLLPWLILYELVVALGVPHDAVAAYMPFERRWPVVEASEVAYASVYVVTALAPALARTRHDLRVSMVRGLLSISSKRTG